MNQESADKNWTEEMETRGIKQTGNRAKSNIPRTLGPTSFLPTRCISLVKCPCVTTLMPGRKVEVGQSQWRGKTGAETCIRR